MDTTSSEGTSEKGEGGEVAGVFSLPVPPDTSSPPGESKRAEGAALTWEKSALGGVPAAAAAATAAAAAAAAAEAEAAAANGGRAVAGAAAAAATADEEKGLSALLVAAATAKAPEVASAAAADTSKDVMAVEERADATAAVIVSQEKAQVVRQSEGMLSSKQAACGAGPMAGQSQRASLLRGLELEQQPQQQLEQVPKPRPGIATTKGCNFRYGGTSLSSEV